jgi:C4-dicarboxylate-specific signal transduction histidine kinase
MKRLLVTPIVLLLISLSGFSQNVDSILMDDFQKVNQKMDRIIYSLEMKNEALLKENDSLFSWNNQLMEKLDQIENQAEKQYAETKTILIEENRQLEIAVEDINKRVKPKFIVLYVLLGVTILLIIYLLIILRISRRESIEYLLSQTDGLSQQNYEIIEKAKDLKKIKKNLKDLIKEQKAQAKSKKQKKKKK